MPFFLLAAPAILALAAWLWISRAKPGPARQARIRHAFAIGLLLAGGLLSLRGAVVIGGPVALAGLGLIMDSVRRSAGLGGGGGGPVGTTGEAPMSDAEARELLGVDADAGAEEIEAAYRALIKKVHPDTGGTAGLARRLRAARDQLLG